MNVLIYSERELFTLLENVFTIKVCRVVFEKFNFQKVERERYKTERVTVYNFYNLREWQQFVTRTLKVTSRFFSLP